MSLLSREELIKKGFASIGDNVAISSKASFYGASYIHIGDNVRIDDFCVLSSSENGIYIGNNIHIAVYSSLIGRGKIVLDDYSNISSRVSIYSSNDDYSGEFMTSPVIPEQYTRVYSDSVTIESHVIVGAGSVILPGVTISRGAAIGALSLINKNVDAFDIVAGVPARKINVRKRNLLALQKDFEEKRKPEN